MCLHAVPSSVRLSHEPPSQHPHPAPLLHCCRSPARPRYSCHPPRLPTYEAARHLPSLTKRYRRLYIPGDFAGLSACWLQGLQAPPGLAPPLALDHHVGFSIIKPEEDKVGCAGGVEQE